MHTKHKPSFGTKNIYFTKSKKRFHASPYKNGKMTSGIQNDYKYIHSHLNNYIEEQQVFKNTPHFYKQRVSVTIVTQHGNECFQSLLLYQDFSGSLKLHFPTVCLHIRQGSCLLLQHHTQDHVQWNGPFFKTSMPEKQAQPWQHQHPSQQRMVSVRFPKAQMHISVSVIQDSSMQKTSVTGCAFPCLCKLCLRHSSLGIWWISWCEKLNILQIYFQY